ncbi:MAG: TrmB family transcriptional regulator [Candidatus Hodarchaeales archaeon]|jgi:sugar-specific transcriptional regulator TrmB
MVFSELKINSQLMPKDLEMFGLTSYEAKTYLNMLSIGFTTAKDISNLSSIPFGRIYDVLTSLEHKGLVDKQDSRPKRFIAKEPKIALKNLIDIKNQELNSIKESASTIEERLTKMYNLPPDESLFWSVAMEEETMKRHSQKLLEAEDEVLMYINMATAHTAMMPEKELQEGMEVLRILTQEKGIKIKILMGGIAVNGFKESYLENFLPFYHILKNIETRFTSMITNNFDIIDKEKILLKIANPVDSNQFIALIYLWQKTFAEKMRSKFFDLWESGGEVNINLDLI